jgi:cyclase
MALEARIIPVLLLHNDGLYKTKQFKNPKYVGDPINAVRIFNEKEVDELLILDVDCSVQKKDPNFELIEEIASEAFMPVGYGGGISSLDTAKRVFQLGVEKVVINTALAENTDLISSIANIYGAQAVVASIDYKKRFFGGSKAYFINGSNKSHYTPVDLARKAEDAGVGELILNSIDREGSYRGYDLVMLEAVVNAVNIPVVISGGAGSVNDFDVAKKLGASAMAAGSMFIYQRPYNAVLISYPSNYFYKK